MSCLRHLLTFAAAAKLLPSCPHPCTLWRWARKGLRARNGRLVYLEHARHGRHIYTTAEALEAFGRALAEADVSEAD